MTHRKTTQMHGFSRWYHLTKPGIVYGNLMTGIAGFLFGTQWPIDVNSFLLFAVGTTFVIASACVFNNCIDRGIDEKMTRTQTRALVVGAISLRMAILYATLLGIIGFAALTFTNSFVLVIATIAYVSYIVIYGLAKRSTPYSTLIGTIPGAASLVAGYAAATGRIDLSAWLLAAIMLVWQMAHFYAIATFRAKEYAAAGLPVWPVKHGVRSTKIQIMAYIGMFLLLNIALAVSVGMYLTYILAVTAVSIYWLYIGVRRWHTSDDIAWAKRMFGWSLVALMTFSVMLAIGPHLP